MQVQEKTAKELADIVIAKANIGALFVSVHPNPAYGWHATVMTAPAHVISYQQYIEQVVAELRPFYKLKH